MDDIEVRNEIISILSGDVLERGNYIKANNICFAHYTSAEVACKIVNDRRIWMRNSKVMNDPSEIDYGHSIISEFFEKTTSGQNFASLIDNAHMGLMKDIKDSFWTDATKRSLNTYILSISEHGISNSDEDKYGRLSMWRAYGGRTNVAMIFNNKPFFVESNSLNAYLLPVSYVDTNGFTIFTDRIIQLLDKKSQLLRSIDRGWLQNALVRYFYLMAQSIKHPAYAEEREWRLIHTSDYMPEYGSEDLIEMTIESVGGVPQKVLKIPLENNPGKNYTGVSVPEILKEIIVGPTEFGWPLHDALVSTLISAKVPQAHTKVRYSGIPLRR